jgi:hypothetical protein
MQFTGLIQFKPVNQTNVTHTFQRTTEKRLLSVLRKLPRINTTKPPPSPKPVIYKLEVKAKSAEF